MVLSARLARLSAGAATGLFFAYSALNGLTFASLFILYDVTTLVYVFGMTAVYFGALAPMAGLPSAICQTCAVFCLQG